MKAIIALPIAILLTATSAIADEPEKNGALTKEQAEFLKPEPEIRGVGMLFEWIELDHRTANKLIRKHATRLNSDALREILEKMLDEEKAELLETVYFVSTDGQRAKIESVDEHLYPTEYDPPEIPQKIHKDMPLDQIPISPANPTAFDVRNVGTTVEAEANVDRDGQSIDINLAPEIVQHLGDRTIGDPKTLHAALAHVCQPQFYVVKIQTNLSLQNGEHALVGLFTPAGKPDKRVMLIVRATVLR
jgi:hypothetical protein